MSWRFIEYLEDIKTQLIKSDSFPIIRTNHKKDIRGLFYQTNSVLERTSVIILYDKFQIVVDNFKDGGLRGDLQKHPWGDS